MADLSEAARILIVEDEALILLDMESTLLDAGAQLVVTATSVAEALTALDSHTFDLVVLDLHLQDGSSHGIAERLQARNVPFLLTSGSFEMVDSFADAPALNKPFSGEQLLAALGQLRPFAQSERQSA